MDEAPRCPRCQAYLELPSVAVGAVVKCPRCRSLIATQHAITAEPNEHAAPSQAIQAGMPPDAGHANFEFLDLRIVRPPPDLHVALAVCGTFALVACVDGLVLMLESDKAQAILALLHGEPMEVWWPTLHANRTLLSLVSLVTWIAAPAAVMYWIYVAYGSLPVVQGLTYSPAQAVRSCFIPWHAPYLPQRIMQEIWKASDGTAPADSAAWQTLPGSWLIRLWWAFFLLRLVRINITIIPFPVHDRAALTTLLWASCVNAAACLLGALASVLFCVIVLRIHRRLWQRYDRLYAESA